MSFDELKKRDNTSWNIAQLIFQANLRVTKMEGLGELLASSSPKAQEQLYRVLSSQNWLMGNMGMQVMDSKGGFETISTPFPGCRTSTTSSCWMWRAQRKCP